jgi:hypothetical protein
VAIHHVWVLSKRHSGKANVKRNIGRFNYQAPRSSATAAQHRQPPACSPRWASQAQPNLRVCDPTYSIVGWAERSEAQRTHRNHRTRPAGTPATGVIAKPG